MSKIKNIQDLRVMALETLEKLRDKEIKIEEASAIGKLCDNVIGTIRVQIEYNRMTGENHDIPFMMMNNKNLIEGKAVPVLDHKKK